MVVTPEKATAFLKDRVQPVPVKTQQEIQKLIADLDSDKYAVRTLASKQLLALHEAAVPPLKKALKSQLTSVEQQQRITALLSALQQPPSTDRLRVFRALEILEYIADAEAKHILKTVAAGMPGAEETAQASSTLKRFGKQ